MAVGRMGRVINLLPLSRIKDGGLRALSVRERCEVHVEASPLGNLSQQGSIHPIHHGAVQLAWSVKAQPVLIEFGDENILHLQVSARTQQRQRVAETFESARAQMEPDIAGRPGE